MTIKALHVNGKEMTLAVFRQLPSEPHHENNEYWGRVNYTVSDEGSRWFVFSRDGVLYRRKIEDWKGNVKWRGKQAEIDTSSKAFLPKQRMSLNRGTAEYLGITIPPNVRSMADEVY